jgi:hypothetical protein
VAPTDPDRVDHRRDPRTPAQLRQIDEARRSARFTFARRRIEKIVDTWPPLTQEQRDKLAEILTSGRSS